ncbi:hypothetical protein CRUP_023951 [Coryphaenoides rupestris]|nr:hypothetical protein CRUP_023951 [Coryphaenoides rupestris]
MLAAAWRLLLWELAVKLPYHVITASLCLGGSDIFTAVRENSPVGQFIANLSINGDPGGNAIRLCLSGKNADWLFLDGRTIRLNSSLSKVLDRELAPVNSVVFTVKATDADEDTLLYVIDTSLPDASYFRIDLPNSGNVVLDKRLDYESKTQLQLVIYAVEMSTSDRYSTTAAVTVHVQDGDDQYPLFLPCTPAASGQVKPPICITPVYLANVTERDQAMDGDRGLKTRLTFTLLSGADNGRFAIDNETGEYSVATALVRVLAENRFPPTFPRTTYKGFVVQRDSLASIVSTYGNHVLLVVATDRDFANGMNPKVGYALHPPSASEGLYYITREGVVIARTERLRAFDRHILEESGDRATASLDIEVLQRGQSVPRGQVQEEYLFGDVDWTRLAGGIGVILLVLVVTVALLAVHVVSPSQVSHPSDDLSFTDVSLCADRGRERGRERASSESLRGRPGLYTRRQSMPPPPPIHVTDQEGSTAWAPGNHPLGTDPGSVPRGCTALSSTLKHAGKTSRRVQNEDEDATTCSTRRLAAPKDLYAVAGWAEGRPPAMEEEDHWRSAGSHKASRGKASATAMKTIEGGGARSQTAAGEASAEPGDESPYRSMHAVICVSDEDDDG